MANESKIVLANKQNGTTTEIIDSNSKSNVIKKFLLPDESGKLITEENASSIYLTKVNAESINRKLEDSYSKAETDNKLREKLSVSTYNTDKGTFATKTELSNGLNAKANQASTYTKNEVDSRLTAKANANATVNLTGTQTISGNKTFRSPLVVANGTANNHAVNLAQLNTKADRNYVKKRGGFVNVNFNLSSGQGILIDLNLGINFNVIVQSGVSANMRVINAASNIGQSGEIYVANGAGVSSFSAPFNFRVAQSGFGNNEVFSYLVVSATLVRITRS